MRAWVVLLAACSLEHGRVPPRSDGSVDARVDSPPMCPDNPGAVFCDGFEDPALAAWYLDVRGGGSSAQRSTTTQHTGAAGLQTTIAAGSESASAIAAALNNVSSGELFARAWFRVSNSIEHADLIELVPTVGNGIALYVYQNEIRAWNDMLSTGTSSSTNVTTNQWFCAEVHVHIDATNGTIEVFIDDTQVLVSTAQNTLPAAGFGNVLVGIPFTSGAQGPLAVDVDDVVAGTQRIGCN